MSTYDFDLFTIGAGSGGVRASRLAASSGARVAVAEKRHLGGTCVNLGCVPKKLFSYAGHFADDFEDAGPYGWNVGEADFDWARLVENKNREISRLNGIYENLLVNAGVKIIEGHARFIDPHTVEVGEKRYTAEKILIATGSWPSVPPIPGAELAVSSNEMFHLKQFPKRVVIAGGGYIAVEFAGIMHGMGAEVVLVHRGPMVLRGFDEDIRKALTEAMGARGIDMRMSTTVERVSRQDDETLELGLSDGRTVSGDLALAAVGRHPNTQNLGIENAGVNLDKNGAVIVDDYFRTNQPHIFALGDIINRVTLTPVALSEAVAFVETQFRQREIIVDYDNIPSAVFSHPPIGTVGLTEDRARDRFGEVDVYESGFRALKNTVSGRAERTYLKMIVDPKTDRVLGCHMIGPDAPEIIQGVAVALKAGATKTHFDSTVGIHPTSAEELVTLRNRRN